MTSILVLIGASSFMDFQIAELPGHVNYFTPDFNVAPNNQLGDGVDKSNVPFLTTFPYVASPLQGYESR